MRVIPIAKILKDKKAWLGAGLLLAFALFFLLFPGRAEEPLVKIRPTPTPRFGRLWPPEEAVIKPYPYLKKPSLEAAILAEGWPTFPKEVKVFQAQPLAKTQAEGASLARRFGFAGEGEDEGGGRRVWTRSDALFRFDKKRQFFEYYGTPPATASADLSLPELQEKAKEVLLAAKLFKKEASLRLKKTVFLRTAGLELEKVEDFKKAAEVEFAFTLLLENLPVIAREGQLYPSVVHLDKKGGLTMLRQFLVREPGEAAAYPLKDFKQVSTALAQRKESLLSVETVGFEIPEVLQYTVYQAELFYLPPKADEEFFQPIFVFSGQGQTKEGKLVEVKSFLPAVLD